MDYKRPERNSCFLSQYPLYCSDWLAGEPDTVALSTYKEGSSNKIQVIQGTADPEGIDWEPVAEAQLDYPVTHLQWDPANTMRLAASSELLRLYKLDYDPEPRLVQTHSLANNTTNKDDINTYPPVTSFDWNTTDPSIIITSSIDTTCTVWDLHRSYEGVATVKTQLIAHDSEVFDVKFISKSTNIFSSVGNDGSMRVFDLRSLEHSTIIYEPAVSKKSTALLKLSTSNIDQHHLATIGVNSNEVIIIDMRMPGLPVATIDGSLGGVSNAPINSIQWHPSSNFLLTGGDDCQALVWDCSKIVGDSGTVIDCPVLAYEEDTEVNNVCWRQDHGDWIGVVGGKGFQAVAI
ncbi:hypothetical protein DICA3_B10396 [Diutina catenulata]